MRSKMNRIYVLSFLFTLHIAISAYINSTFLLKIIPAHYVGILYAVASLLTLFLLSESSAVLRHLGNRKLTFLFLVGNLLGLLGLITSANPYIIAFSFILLLLTNTLILFCMDIFIEHFGNPETIGRTRGLYLTITNLGWVVSPILSGFIITKTGGYQSIYILSFVITVLVTLGILYGANSFTDKKYAKTPFLKTYRYLKKNKHIFAVTAINFILQFFFAWMVVYTPIYLNEYIGLNWSQIGIIFTVMLSPFVLFGLPTGILIDKYHVKKRTLIAVGIIIASIATILMARAHTSSILFWAGILFATRLGATLIETTTEVYFFTHVREEDAHLLSVFRDMAPLSFIIAPLLGTAFLSFFPFKYLFIALGIIVFSSLYYVGHLKHNHRPDTI